MKNLIVLLLLPVSVLISCGEKESSQSAKRVKRVNMDSLVRNAPTAREVMESFSPEMRKEIQDLVDSLPGLELKMD